MQLFEFLIKRGFIHSSSSESEDKIKEITSLEDFGSYKSSLQNLLDNKKFTFYIGIDTTSNSLHIGHLFSILFALNLVRYGNKCIFIMGGGTTKLGDPSGKENGREMLSYDVIEGYMHSIENQLKNLIKNINENGIKIDLENIEFMNNATWLDKLNYIEFVRDIGSHFKINDMIKKTIYKDRIFQKDGDRLFFADNGKSLSFPEFNYQLIQAYDFLYLFENKNCILQIGGSDQWTNITKGCDLIKSIHKASSYALVFPLITDDKGKKIGKTENVALFLDANMVSPFDFFQYFINILDTDVYKFLKNLTFLSFEKIDEILDFDILEQKKQLAYEVTSLVHGPKKAKECLQASKNAFSNDFSDTSSLPSINLKRNTIEVDGVSLKLKDIIRISELIKSNSEVKQRAKEGAIYVFGEKIDLLDINKSYKDFIQDDKIYLSVGKKRLVINISNS